MKIEVPDQVWFVETNLDYEKLENRAYAHGEPLPWYVDIGIKDSTVFARTVVTERHEDAEARVLEEFASKMRALLGSDE